MKPYCRCRTRQDTCLRSKASTSRTDCCRHLSPTQCTIASLFAPVTDCRTSLASVPPTVRTSRMVGLILMSCARSNHDWLGLEARRCTLQPRIPAVGGKRLRGVCVIKKWWQSDCDVCVVLLLVAWSPCRMTSYYGTPKATTRAQIMKARIISGFTTSIFASTSLLLLLKAGTTENVTSGWTAWSVAPHLQGLIIVNMEQVCSKSKSPKTFHDMGKARTPPPSPHPA